ncbi:MAG: hypothetical protein KatS3mg124_0547 [Porticoccaceae bacterium]|nr:MAG: hypothetical protein KatS3mg124_0547 [Porticoccaceae bacterium]
MAGKGERPAALRREGDRLVMEGAVTVHSAPDLFARLPELLVDPPAALEIDCSGLEGADSAALALLVELARALAARGAQFAVRGLDPHLERLARLYGIEWILDG